MVIRSPAAANRSSDPPTPSAGHGTLRQLDDGIVLVEQIELLNRKKRRTRIDLANAIFEYIEIFDNRQRRHSKTGYISPIEHELRFDPLLRKGRDDALRQRSQRPHMPCSRACFDSVKYALLETSCAERWRVVASRQPKQERAVRRKQGLLQTAAELISADGYAETSLVKIAAESGSTPGSLAFFFATKQGVAEDVIAGGIALVEQAVREQTDALVSPVARLAVGTITVSESLEREPMVRAMVRLLTEESLFAEQWASHQARTIDLVRSHLAQAVHSNELPTLDEKTTALLIVTIMIGIASAARGGATQPGAGRKSLATFWRMHFTDERVFELESLISSRR